MKERLLRLAQVEDKTGFKKSYLYREMRDGNFPKPIKLGSTSRWKESDIDAWINALIHAQSGPSAA